MKQIVPRPVWLALAVLSALACAWLLAPARSVQAAPAEVRVPGVASSQIPPGPVGQPGLRAHTVYMDGSGGKKDAARHMNSLHEVMREKGWTFESLVAHEENNDLEGWWITYVAR